MEPKADRDTERALLYYTACMESPVWAHAEQQTDAAQTGCTNIHSQTGFYFVMKKLDSFIQDYSVCFNQKDFRNKICITAAKFIQ